MAKKDLIDSIDVATPCPKSWDAMFGGDKARFCGSCGKDVHNISELTRGEVKKLLFRSQESVCIRIEKNADGKVKTLGRQLHHITRRVPLAAGILSASLTLSAAASAQDKIEPAQMEKTIVSRTTEKAKSTASIAGTVKDPSGAFVANALITLHNTKTQATQTVKSKADGSYKFEELAAEIYELTAEADGFQKSVYQNIAVSENGSLQISIILETGKIEFVGLFAETPQIIEPTEAVISDKVESRQMEPLPAFSRNMSFLGLFAAGKAKPVGQTASQNKNSSQISFAIYDPNNQPVPNETVELTNQKTKREFTALTDQTGTAQFDSIPRGRYNLIVSGNGFNENHQTIHIKEPIEPNVKLILDVGTVTGEFSLDWSEIPLFRAIAQDDNETVERLINTGFAVNTKDENEETALHVAVQHGNLEIVRFLLDKSVKVNVKDKSKRTPLAMLFDSFTDDKQLEKEIIRLLVSRGANIDVRDEDSQTFLMRAAEDDNLEDVRFFLDLGANANIKDEDNETAFDKTDSEAIKNLLISYGTNR